MCKEIEGELSLSYTPYNLLVWQMIDADMPARLAEQKAAAKNRTVRQKFDDFIHKVRYNLDLL